MHQDHIVKRVGRLC